MARLACSGRADEGRGQAVTDTLPNHREALRPERAGHVDLHAAAAGLDLGQADSGVLADVGLIEDHRGLGPARPDSSEVAFDPADIEVRVEAADDEHQIDVGGDNLRADLGPSGSTGEYGTPGEQVVDGSGAIGPGFILEDDPVANAGNAGILQLEAKSPGELRLACAGARPDLVGTAMLRSNSRGDDFRGCEVTKLFFEEWAEAQCGELVHDCVLHGRGRRHAQVSRVRCSSRRSARHADRDQRLRRYRRAVAVSARGALESSRKIHMENGGDHNTSARAIAPSTT